MFIQRDARGQVCAAYTVAQFGGQAEVRNDDPGLIRYLTKNPISAALYMNLGISPDDIAVLATRTGKYVDRGARDKIISASDTPTRDFQERVPLDAAELVAFTKQQPPEPAPNGFRYQQAGNGWQILWLDEGSLLVEGLPDREDCVAFMRERADRLRKGAAAYRATWETQGQSVGPGRFGPGKRK
jgi:hypothetical protein